MNLKEENLDPEDWEKMRTLGHTMLDDMINTLQNVRNNNAAAPYTNKLLETRQAQLFMGLYETYRSPQFRKQWTTILNQEYTDFDDFWEKYGLENNPDAWANWQSVASFFHGMGILVKKGLVEPNLLDELSIRHMSILERVD